MRRVNQIVIMFALISLVAVAGCDQDDKGTAAKAPSWFPLGPEVYQEQDRFQAEKEVLSFGEQPYWFLGFPKLLSKEEYEAHKKEEERRLREREGMSVMDTLVETVGLDGGEARYVVPQSPPYPKSLADLPMTDQGASLSLKIEEADSPDILHFTLTLKATERAAWEEVMHRNTNTLPFVFAFFADGEPVTTEVEDWEQIGGMNDLVMLVEKGADKTWNLKVSTNSIKGLLGNSKPRTLEVVAAFSERRHEAHFGDEEVVQRLSPLLLPALDRPQILIRSNVVKLNWADGKWSVEK